MRDSMSASQAPTRRRCGRVITIVLLCLMALTVVAMVGGRNGLQAYDSSHMISVTCSVSSAKGEIGSTNAGRGVGTRFNQVAIETENCGPLILRRGVTGDNKARIAAQLSTGRQFTFRVGAGSFHLRSLLATLRTPVIVTEYRSAS